MARELSDHDALRAHLEVELGLHAEDLVNPWHAALSSAIAFVLGAALPMLAISLPSAEWRIPATFVSVLLALTITGVTSAAIGGGPRIRAAVRLVVGGALALATTYLVGGLFDASGIA